MKCLSICQPFAELVISGRKTIELRNWNTKYRGEFLIHAPLKIRTEDCVRLKITNELKTGVIVGKAELYDVKKYQSFEEIKQDQKFHWAKRKFYKNCFGFLVKNPKRFMIPIPYKGRLGFFDVELPKNTIKKKDIITEIIDEEFRYQWIGHH